MGLVVSSQAIDFLKLLSLCLRCHFEVELILLELFDVNFLDLFFNFDTCHRLMLTLRQLLKHATTQLSLIALLV